MTDLMTELLHQYLKYTYIQKITNLFKIHLIKAVFDSNNIINQNFINPIVRNEKVKYFLKIKLVIE